MKSILVTFLIVTLLTSSLTLGIQNEKNIVKRDDIPGLIDSNTVLEDDSTLVEQVTVEEDVTLTFEEITTTVTADLSQTSPLIINNGNVELAGIFVLDLDHDEIDALLTNNEIAIVESTETGTLTVDNNFDVVTSGVCVDSTIDTNEESNNYYISFVNLQRIIANNEDCVSTVSTPVVLGNHEYHVDSTVTVTTGGSITFGSGTKTVSHGIVSPLIDVTNDGAVSLDGDLVFRLSSADIETLESDGVVPVVEGHDDDDTNIFNVDYEAEECVDMTVTNVVEDGTYAVSFENIQRRIANNEDCVSTVSTPVVLGNHEYHVDSTVTVTTGGSITFGSGTKTVSHGIVSPLIDVTNDGAVSLDGDLTIKLTESDVNLLQTNNVITLVSGHDNDEGNVFDNINFDVEDGVCVHVTHTVNVEGGVYSVTVDAKRYIGNTGDCSSTIDTNVVLVASKYYVSTPVTIEEGGSVQFNINTDLEVDYQFLVNDPIFDVTGGSLQLNGDVKISLENADVDSHFTSGNSLRLVSGESTGSFASIETSVEEDSCVHSIVVNTVTPTTSNYDINLVITRIWDCLTPSPSVVSNGNGIIFTGEENEISSTIEIEDDGFVTFSSSSKTTVNVNSLTDDTLFVTNGNSLAVSGSFVFSFSSASLFTDNVYSLNFYTGTGTVSSPVFTAEITENGYAVEVSSDGFDEETESYVIEFNLFSVVPSNVDTDSDLSGEFNMVVVESDPAVTVTATLTFVEGSSTTIRGFSTNDVLFEVTGDGVIDIEDDTSLIFEFGQEEIDNLRDSEEGKKRALTLTIIDGQYTGTFSSITASINTNDECDNVNVTPMNDDDQYTVTFTYEGCPVEPTDDTTDSDGGDSDGGDNNDSSDDDDDDDDGLTGGAIAGIVIASVLGALVIGVLIFLISKKKCGGSKSSSSQTRSYEAQTKPQSRKEPNEQEEETSTEEEDTEEDEEDDDDSEEDSEEESSEEGSEEESEEESSELEESSEEGSDDSDEGSEDSDEGSEDSDEGSEDSDEGSSDEESS